jgi:myo-inositol-1(or 4)-monophosphatase
MTAALVFAVGLARQAGELLSRMHASGELAPRLKDDSSLVTQADIESDRLIAAAIRQSFPDDLLLSEELQPDYPSGQAGSAQAVWVIDPLDGTTNFHLGLPFWGVSIARLVGGWPESAALYFPQLGELYSAQKGQGAWLNGQPLQVRRDQFRRLSFFACCSRTLKLYNVDIPYKTRILGSAAYTLCAVARNIAILGFETITKIWDIAGAWLVLQEAGAQVATLDGQQPLPLRPGLDYARQSFSILAAADSERLAWARPRIAPK